MGYTSTITRIRSVQHQPRPDNLHQRVPLLQPTPRKGHPGWLRPWAAGTGMLREFARSVEEGGSVSEGSRPPGPRGLAKWGQLNRARRDPIAFLTGLRDQYDDVA